MKNIHKTLAIAAAAAIAGINVWNAQDTSVNSDLMIGDVEHVAVAQTDYQFGNNSFGYPSSLSNQQKNKQSVVIRGNYENSQNWGIGASYNSGNGNSIGMDYNKNQGVSISGNYNQNYNTSYGNFNFGVQGSYNFNSGQFQVMCTVGFDFCF
ncbi:MAG: hypothetical protein E7069_06640 [Bacteroidales bacterium]|nr:hypothetical protein [Bacteroidales bacterium]